jgi:hypothetical protein
VKPFIFIAMLFCMGAAALLGGGIAVYENIDFALHAKAATMEIADPGKKLSLAPGGPDIHLVAIRYSGPNGQVLVPNKLLGREHAMRLANGEKIPVFYFENNPQKFLLSKDELPSPWLWLVLGVALMVTFRYAVVLRRREALESDA